MPLVTKAGLLFLHMEKFDLYPNFENKCIVLVRSNLVLRICPQVL